MMVISQETNLLVLWAGFVLIAFLFYFPFKIFISTEINMSFSNDMDDEYEKLFRRLNPPRCVSCRFFIFFSEFSHWKWPKIMKRIRFISVLFTSFFPYFFVCVRVVIDNEACKNATVIRVRFLSFFGVCACSSLPLFLVFYWVPIVSFCDTGWQC